MTVTHLLDASAVLALVANEPGTPYVQGLLNRFCGGITAVNLAEVASKLMDRGAPMAVVEDLHGELGLEVLSVGTNIGLAAAALRAGTRHLGLSLADRICLGAAQHLGITAVTADRAWAEVAGIDVQVIR